MILEKCPDKSATIEFTLKTTLVAANAGSDSISQMSDAVSAYDSGPESEFAFEDFHKNEENKLNTESLSAIQKIRMKINKQSSSVVRREIK